MILCVITRSGGSALIYFYAALGFRRALKLWPKPLNKITELGVLSYFKFAASQVCRNVFLRWVLSDSASFV